jgi:hypothetical protein
MLFNDWKDWVAQAIETCEEADARLRQYYTQLREDVEECLRLDEVLHPRKEADMPDT